MGSGRVNLLSGRIRCYRTRFGSATWSAPRNPLGRDTDWQGRAVDSAQMLNSIKKFFSFSNLFYKLSINLNSKKKLKFNDFYSHNKIQEHFITPRKICNDMNATNNYLFKYITL
jgi:hypothetical protein